MSERDFILFCRKLLRAYKQNRDLTDYMAQLETLLVKHSHPTDIVNR